MESAARVFGFKGMGELVAARVNVLWEPLSTSFGGDAAYAGKLLGCRAKWFGLVPKRGLGSRWSIVRFSERHAKTVVSPKSNA